MNGLVECDPGRKILFWGFGGRKGPNSMGKMGASGPFDSAPPSAVSRDRSVTRSAQDDVFVGVLTKNIQNDEDIPTRTYRRVLRTERD